MRLLLLAVVSASVLVADERRGESTGEAREPAGSGSEREKTKYDAETLAALESSFLRMFGLSRRPQLKGKVHVPQHMLQLYKERAGLDTDDDVDISKPRRRTKQYAGNTVRSFFSEGEFTTPHAFARPRHTILISREILKATRDAPHEMRP